MDAGFRQRVSAAWSERFSDIRSPPATDLQIAEFERRFGPIPSDYRWFLQACGGGVVGSEWVDDITKLARTHEKFAAESVTPNGWRMRGVFIIGWDGSGNPFGIEVQSGTLLVEDHNFGGVHIMAPSLEAFLENGLLAPEC